MRKTLVATSVVLLMGAGSAGAAFLEAGTSGTIDFNAGCFTFGACVIGGLGDITDNDIDVRGNGTAVGGDGLVGQVGFTVGSDGNTLTITSYQQDTYTGTAGGNFALTGNVAGSSGFISDAGDVTLTLERAGYPQNFAILDGAAWNVDDSSIISDQGDPVSGVLDSLTTGSDTGWQPGEPGTPINPVMGSPLVAAGTGMWTGTIVLSSNVGDAWDFFSSNPFTEQFNVTVNGTAATVIPVPAAVWLFGSGLLGLVGVARRKKG